MKIFSAAQIREWDAYTIKNEPVASLELMNRAARVFCDWLTGQYPDTTRRILVMAGTGNNGGDGLAVARMLDQAQYNVKVVVCHFGTTGTDDFKAQLAMIPDHASFKPLMAASFVEVEAVWGKLSAETDLIIDALFGSGLNRNLSGDYAQVVTLLNQSTLETISIDMPSGLFADQTSNTACIVQADKTFSFQCPKLAFMFPENARWVGEWVIGDIGLHPAFAQETPTPFYFLQRPDARSLIKPRQKFAHKGTYGHALLVAGSWGKMGAAVLAAQSCLRAGAGLLTVHTPLCGQIVLQTCVPEAMVHADSLEKHCGTLPELAPFSSIGIGPGIGRAPETAAVLQALLEQAQVPLVLDADALNILAATPALLDCLPPDTMLTPHPKEFERLFGSSQNSYERIALQRDMALRLQATIILKGAFTSMAFPDGSCWFNSTGNPGMATGGAGDVLTGLLTGLLAQGYAAKEATLLGVYLHGLAGDLAAADYGQEALVAGDIWGYLGKAWQQLH